MKANQTLMHQSSWHNVQIYYLHTLTYPPLSSEVSFAFFLTSDSFWALQPMSHMKLKHRPTQWKQEHHTDHAEYAQAAHRVCTLKNGIFSRFQDSGKTCNSSLANKKIQLCYIGIIYNTFFHNTHLCLDNNRLKKFRVPLKISQSSGFHPFGDFQFYGKCHDL